MYFAQVLHLTDVCTHTHTFVYFILKLNCKYDLNHILTFDQLVPMLLYTITAVVIATAVITAVFIVLCHMVAPLHTDNKWSLPGQDHHSQNTLYILF